jgi:hypothetical protein
MDGVWRFLSFCEELVWPQRQIHLKLVNRTRTIHAQPSWYSFSTLVRKEKVPYRIILGEPTTAFPE